MRQIEALDALEMIGLAAAPADEGHQLAKGRGFLDLGGVGDRDQGLVEDQAGAAAQVRSIAALVGPVLRIGNPSRPEGLALS